MTADAPLRSSVAIESLLLARRLLTHWLRERIVPAQAVLFPTFLLIIYQLLVGKSMMRVTGMDSLYGVVPTCAVAGAMFGALASGLSIPLERDSGLLSRMWVLPINRASILTGRLLAEAARTVLASALITAVGISMGLRFNGGWFAVIPFILVPALVVVIFSAAVIAIAVRSKTGAPLIWLGAPAIAAVFSSSGTPPPEMLPGWMRPLIALQPMSPTIESMRALAHGEPALWPLLLTLVWAVGLGVVIGPLAVRGYRAAAESAPC